MALAETLLHSEKKKINPQFPFISHYLLPFCFVFLSIKTLSTLLTNIVVVISFLSVPWMCTIGFNDKITPDIYLISQSIVDIHQIFVGKKVMDIQYFTVKFCPHCFSLE